MFSTSAHLVRGACAGQAHHWLLPFGPRAPVQQNNHGKCSQGNTTSVPHVWSNWARMHITASWMRIGQSETVAFPSHFGCLRRALPEPA